MYISVGFLWPQTNIHGNQTVMSKATKRIRCLFNYTNVVEWYVMKLFY